MIEITRRVWERRSMNQVFDRFGSVAHQAPSDSGSSFSLFSHICTSVQMQRIYQLVQRASAFDFPVLLCGESGTGKELAARTIHFRGKRQRGPFLPVDCAALPPTLIESELFGHVRGSFTGADKSRIGLLQVARGGTAFLDEIGELPLQSQAKLLRCIQEGQIRPVGGNEPSQIDVRFIAATNRDLQREVKAGRFRQDLLFRMNILQIELPPLRSRKSDIPPLVALFLAKHKDLNSSIRAISDDAMRLLVSYHWPGNVRELEHSIEHAFAMGDGPAIEIDDLPPSLSRTRDLEALPLDETLTLQELERRAIFRALKETRGDRLEAARLLNIGKTTLYRRLKQYQRDMTCER